MRGDSQNRQSVQQCPSQNSRATSQGGQALQRCEGERQGGQAVQRRQRKLHDYTSSPPIQDMLPTEIKRVCQLKAKMAPDGNEGNDDDDDDDEDDDDDVVW